MNNVLNKKQKVLEKLEAGESVASVIKSEQVSILRINRWAREFTSSGRDLNLFQEKQSIVHYQGLTPKQIKWLYFVLINKTPESFDFDSFLWTRYLFEHLVLKWCKKNYDRTAIYKLIKYMGFDFPELEPKLVKLKNSSELAIYRSKNYQFYYLDIMKFKKSFRVLKDPAGTTGTIIQKVKESDTKFNIVYAHSLHKKGIKFQTKPSPLTEGAAFEFIERFSKEHSGGVCFFTPKNNAFASPDLIKHVEQNFPNIIIRSI